MKTGDKFHNLSIYINITTNDPFCHLMNNKKNKYPKKLKNLQIQIFLLINK